MAELSFMDKDGNIIAFDPARVRPYGDTMNDGKVQLSFTLPIKADETAKEAAKLYAMKMGIEEPSVVHMGEMGVGFSFFVVFGSCSHSIDITNIKVTKVETTTMTMEETDKFIKEKISKNANS